MTEYVVYRQEGKVRLLAGTVQGREAAGELTTTLFGRLSEREIKAGVDYIGVPASLARRMHIKA